MLPKLYKSEWKNLAAALSIGWLLFVVILYPQAIDLRRFFTGSLIFLVFLIVIDLIAVKGTSITITPDKKLKNSHVFYHQRTFSVHDITHIERPSSLAGMRWYLFVNFTKENGTPDYTRINLNSYKPEAIQDLLHTLLEISPKIQLDKEVQKMLEQSKYKKRGFSQPHNSC
jgi:hypothetical protein